MKKRGLGNRRIKKKTYFDENNFFFQLFEMFINVNRTSHVKIFTKLFTKDMTKIKFEK